MLKSRYGTNTQKQVVGFFYNRMGFELDQVHYVIE